MFARAAWMQRGLGGVWPPRTRLCAGLGLAAILLAGGCGPASYLAAVRREATRAVAEAGAQGAAEQAPFEWTSALIYLDRARSLAGHARWQDALACGRRATTFARAASQRAQQAARAPK